MVKQSKATVGGIIKHHSGVGFKLTFKNPRMAQKYKSMIIWILEGDDHNVTVNRGYYDTREMK